MRIHFTLPGTSPDFKIETARDAAIRALHECKEAGTVARHVRFKTLTSHKGGGDFASALEIQLEAMTRDRGRRAGNSGSYGAMRSEYDGYAATYDEWGFFLAALYRMDEDARCAPNFKRDIAHYYDAEDFHEKTGRTYDATYPAEVAQWGDLYRCRSGRNQIGRRGYGRVHVSQGSANPQWYTHDERTAEWLTQFQAGEVL